MGALTVPEIDPEWDVLRAAIAYAACGWYVLPVDPHTKRPAKFLRKRWQEQTSRDSDEIAAWFAGTDYLLGLHVGRSGAVVIDLDNYDADDFPIDAKMALDDAPFQSTRDNDPRRGHYVFALPAGRTLGNSRGGLGKGFGEVRGTNGIIVVQPSTHVKEHGRYEWQRTGEVPVLPDEIDSLLPEGQASDSAATDADIKDFLAKHTTEERPTMLKAVLERFAREMTEGARHEALLKHAIWGMREAAAGFYSAQRVWDGLWADFEPALQGERDRFPGSEFRGVMAWAVSQANATDPDVRRAEVEKRLAEAEPFEPEPVGAAVDATASVGIEGANDEADGPDGWARPRPVADYFDPKDGIDVALLADDVLDMGPLAYGRDSTFWHYKDGVWRRDPDVVEGRVVRLLKGRYRHAHVSNAEDVVKHRVGRITCEPTTPYINFTDCMLEWQTDECKPHAQHYGSTVQLPVHYQRDAECPEFEKFLASILPPDYVQLVWEMIGYLMMSGNPQQVAFLLWGPGSNGKGTLMRVIHALLGLENISALTLDALGERFAPMGLFGKLANLAGDIDSTYQETTAGFKRLTGEDPFRGEVKYVAEPFYFVNWAVPVFSINKVFSSSDTTYGYLRRWKVIEFNRKIMPEEVIPGLSNILLGELPGIAAKGMRVLREMMSRNGGKGGFHTAPEIQKGKERFEENVDQVRLFLDQCCMPAPGTRTERSTIYKAYTLWAQSQGLGRLKSTEVAQRLDGIGYPDRKIKGNRYNIGLVVMEHRVQGAIEEEVEDYFD